MGDGLIVADRASEIAVKHTFPVAEILLAEGSVEPEGVTRGGDVGGGCALAEHLLDGITGNEMNQKEDDADHQPDDWESVNDALEKGFQFSGSQWSGLNSTPGAAGTPAI